MDFADRDNGGLWRQIPLRILDTFRIECLLRAAQIVWLRWDERVRDRKFNCPTQIGKDLVKQVQTELID